MDVKKSKVLVELNAYIDQAWGVEKFVGEKEGFSIKHDPALARNLEWIRDCYEALYKDVDESFDEDMDTIKLPKKIIRLDDGMEFLLDEKLGTYHVHLGIPHLDEGDHIRHEYTYECLMSGGGFKVSDGTENIAAMKESWMDRMNSHRHEMGCGYDDE